VATDQVKAPYIGDFLCSFIFAYHSLFKPLSTRHFTK
jgi:hypothetical protein